VRVLVTGANGQLGHDLTRVLDEFEVRALDHAALDITDRQAVADTTASIRPAWIINAAAYNDVDEAETDRDRAFAVNAAGPEYLASAAARFGASIIHISTDYVFDGRKGSPYIETDPAQPVSVYGESKLEGERRVLGSLASACVLRTAGLYGVHGKNFVKTIHAAARAGRPLRVVDDQRVSPTWTWHLAVAIRDLLRTPARGLFHVANAGSCTWFEFAQSIVGGSVHVEAITSRELGRRARRPPNSALDSIRWAQTDLRPLPAWQSALRRFLDELLRTEQEEASQKSV
jgi:dTDP-4-dehydrorhamnose reductase